jgi:uncharacterized protein YceK
MRKIFAGFLMTVMMLSGCGVAKNLEYPGSKPVPTPEASRSVWWHPYHREAPTLRQYVYLEIMIFLGFGCHFLLNTCNSEDSSSG